ncbi:MAG: hypothetical protein CM1200mP28_14320 [Deltaproteobacteria bacterium]|nr:MAG: hypothetical protein CM1200mP28_14320 [Deltaproteobacteria bacterium]
MCSKAAGTRGEVNGIAVYDDFAHHPTAVGNYRSNQAKARDRRIIAVFEPRRTPVCAE